MKDNLSAPTGPAYSSMIEAERILFALEEIFDLWGRFGGKQDFFEVYADPMLADLSTSGEKAISELIETENLKDWKGAPFEPGFKESLLQISMMLVSCSFAIQSTREVVDSPAAWLHVCEASHWLEMLRGTISEKSTNGTNYTFAKKGAKARHAENHAMKRDAFKWCDLNMRPGRSMDSAAAEIAGQQMNITFRTARAWVSEWKKLQSAGRP